MTARMTARVLLRLSALLVAAAVFHGAVLSTGGICGEPQSRSDSTIAASLHGKKEDLSALLGRIMPAGWKFMEAVRRFTPENLWERINGRAEFFLAYDMVRMTLAIYADVSKGDSFIDVSVYDMGNPVNAFGVFSAERPKDMLPVGLGREGYQSGAGLFIWKGRYYLQIIASEDGPQGLKIIRTLGEKLTAALDDTGEPLWGLEALPKVDRIPGSEQYFRKDAMGLDFMVDTFTARYRKRANQKKDNQKEDKLITVFLMRKKNPAAAGEILRQYAAYAKQFGEGVDQIKKNGALVTLCDMGGGFDALFQIDVAVAGVAAADDRELALDSALDIWRHLKGKR